MNVVFCDQLVSLTVSLGLICASECDDAVFFLTDESYPMSRPHFIYLYISWWAHHFLAIMHNAPTSIHKHAHVSSDLLVHA